VNNSEALISVENVSKKFCRDLKKSLWYGMNDIAGEVFCRKGKRLDLRKEEFWALKDVSFELRRGECLGLIGPNGAGKSTLLRLLNGLIKPDSGKISVRGRVGALIALGAGFNPILTGRENIFINGAVLGLNKREIDKKLDEIIDFAEIGDFIDAPVQSYSSGMQVRLGFAIAVQMEPDVLLIDEVLAVGDVGFRSKCYNAIYELNKDAAVIFVSHTMQHISRLCTHLMVLDKGKEFFYSNNVPLGIEKYIELFDSEQALVIEPGKSEILNIKLSAKQQKDYYEINYGDAFIIQFDAIVERKHKDIEISIGIASQALELVAQCNSESVTRILNDGEAKHFIVKIDELNIVPGRYYISLIMRDRETNTMLSWHHLTTKLKITGNFFSPAPIRYIGDWNVKSL